MNQTNLTEIAKHLLMPILETENLPDEAFARINIALVLLDGNDGEDLEGALDDAVSILKSEITILEQEVALLESTMTDGKAQAE